MPLTGLIDTKAEAARLGRDRDKILSEIAGLEAKLSDKGFLSKAPTEVVAKQEERLADSRFRLAALEAILEKLLQ
jgi:valyl-tRNA synthetase